MTFDPLEVLSGEIKTGVENGVIKAGDPEMIAHLIAIIQEGLDYCRFEYRDIQKVETARLLLKGMVFNLMKIEMDASYDGLHDHPITGSDHRRH